MGAIEKIKTMIEQEIAARDAVAAQIAGTDDAIQLTALIAEYGCHCAALSAFMAALEAIEEEQEESNE